MNTTTIIGLSGLFISVFIAYIPYLRKRYFIGPELTIELIPVGGMSMNRGISRKNDTSKGAVEIDKAIYVFEVSWNINLKITNNSSITAFYPKINFLNQQFCFTHLEKLDINKPIKGEEQVILKGKYSLIEEKKGKDRTQPQGLPENFIDLKILLEYKNPYKQFFYTVFTNSSIHEKNRYTRNKPKEFK